jgi:hypothetical protein
MNLIEAVSSATGVKAGSVMDVVKMMVKGGHLTNKEAKEHNAFGGVASAVRHGIDHQDVHPVVRKALHSLLNR